jgi:type I restriction enzyme S subunit
MNEQKASNVPQIRFKEFDGEWEAKPIGDVLSEKKRPIVLKDHQRYELITVKRRNEGIVSRGHLFGREILVKNYSQLQAGDFVISKRQVVHGATGMIPSKLDSAIVSNEYLVAVNNSKLLTEFLTILSSQPAMRQKFFLSSYGVDIEKLFFDVEDWKKRKVTIPNIAEQNQISEYFRALDSLIGLHQRKHDKLVTLKKAMLQKMFPQPGATTPEIRFKGFTADWVEKKIHEMFQVTRGNVLAATKTSPKQTREALYPVYSSQTKNNGLMGYYNSYLFEDAITWTTDGANAGTVCYREGKFYSTNVNGVLLSDRGYANRAVSESLNQEAWKHVSHVGNPKLMNNVMSQIKIFVSDAIEEQQKIGTYFRTLDELISKHATQLQKLQQIKSACLAKMFI